MKTALDLKREALADAEGFVGDIQGNTGGTYTCVWPWDLEDLRNARRYVKILKRDIRKLEAQQQTARN